MNPFEMVVMIVALVVLGRIDGQIWPIARHRFL